MLLVAATCTTTFAQKSLGPLDPTRNWLAGPASPHAALPEQYIRTFGDITAQRPDRSKFPWNRPDLRATPHYFSAHFHVSALTHAATLYIAGPREAHIFLNGHPLGDFYINTDAPIGFHVFHVSVDEKLRSGDNVLAIEAIRGRGVVSGSSPLTTQQLAYGEILAAQDCFGVLRC